MRPVGATLAQGLLVALALLLPGTALTQVGPRWQCGPIGELPAFTLQQEAITLNNFQLREDIGTFSSRPYLELSFSVVNRGPDERFLSVQFLGLGRDGNTALALSAEPTFSIIAGHTSEQLSTSVNSEAGELNALDRFCVRADGSF
jgi:hypothetical protein